MIDFRYHLVSIVAVLLALSIGVILGTGAFGGPLLQDLESNVDELRAELNDRREENARLTDLLEQEQRFATEAEPYLLQGSLDNQAIVVVELQGTDGAVADRVRGAVGAAGGEIAATIEILDKFALSDQVDADSLALAIGSVSGEEDVLREEAAVEIGRRVGAAAVDGTGSGATALLESLQEPGFIDIEREEEADVEAIVPEGAAIIVIGGAADEPAFAADAFVLSLSTAAAAEEAAVVVAEPDMSTWGVVQAIREDGDARDAVATADGADTVAGRVAAVMSVGRALAGEILHLGRNAGSAGFLPQPTPGD